MGAASAIKACRMYLMYFLLRLSATVDRRQVSVLISGFLVQYTEKTSVQTLECAFCIMEQLLSA